jgi:hypothetical protein
LTARNDKGRKEFGNGDLKRAEGIPGNESNTRFKISPIHGLSSY